MITQNKNLFSPEQEALLTRLDSRVAAGTSLLRLHLETGIRQDQLAALIQREPSSRFGWEPSLFETLAQWLDATPAAHELPTTRADTPSFKTISSLLGMAHQSRSLIAITGPVGFGKSFAATCYAAQNPRSHRKPGAVRIQFNKTDNKPSAALAAILAGLHGESVGSYRNGNLYQAVGTKLRPGDFLILDECQRLETAVDIVASLHDDFGVGIAMIGNPDFSNAIWGKDRTFDALGSRILRHDFTHSTGEDIETWLAWKGVLEGLSVKDRAALVKTAVTIGTRPGREGGLRTLSQIMDYAERAYGNQPMNGPLLSVLVKQLKEGV